MKRKEFFVTPEMGRRINTCCYNRLAHPAKPISLGTTQIRAPLHLIPWCLVLPHLLNFQIIFPKEFTNPKEYDPEEWERMSKWPSIGAKYNWRKNGQKAEATLFE
jgi:hypothetical protein